MSEQTRQDSRLERLPYAVRDVNVACGDFATLITEAQSLDELRMVGDSLISDTLSAVMAQVRAYYDKKAELETRR